MTGSLIVSAPGSTMITGEHAVVYGHPAIVAAIDFRVTLTATPLPAPILQIVSDIAPPLRANMTDLPQDGPYRFVLRAVALYRDQLQTGLRLAFASQIDPTLGLGSSAAVSIATLTALNALTSNRHSPAALHGQALGLVRAIQGRGSGADLAASLMGGMLAYQLPDSLLDDTPPGHQARITPLPNPPELGLCYAGYKTPTAQVLAQVAQAMRAEPDRFRRIYADMGHSAQSAIDAARSRDWPGLGAALTAYQTLMDRLGVSDATLNRILQQAAGTPGLLGAKISGSGLGDCVLSLGTRPAQFAPAPLAHQGAILHDD